MTAINQVAAFYVFLKKCVKPKIHSEALAGICFRQVNHAYQLVQRFVIVESIIIGDGLKSEEDIHFAQAFITLKLSGLAAKKESNISNQ
jgi:hypothetical protein